MKRLNVADNKDTDVLFTSSIDALKKLYKDKIKPLETLTRFGDFQSQVLTDADLGAKPMVLLLGQYSTGKTTFIQYLIEREFPGSFVGAEPTTDRFNAVMYGQEDQIIPGHSAVVQESLPYRGLEKFGSGFMSKFQASLCPAPLLEKISFIDTPGVLSGEKQRIGRAYDFPSLVSWYAERSDMILLLFDAHKLDISDEFKSAIESLKGYDDKIKIVLNKADKVSAQQLLRVYGALMFNLGRVIKSPEVMRVYLGSFWNGTGLQNPDTEKLLHAEMVDLIKELLMLPKNAAIRKVNDLVKRARTTKVHALIVSHLRSEMPAVFGRDSKQAELIKNLDKEFNKMERIYGIPSGDFPDVEKYRSILKVQDFSKFPKLNPKMIEQLDEVLAVDFPKLLQRFPIDGSHKPTQYELNPFAIDEVDESLRWTLFEHIDRELYAQTFVTLGPVDGKITGASAKPILQQSGLSNDLLAKIWRLADIDRDGKLDSDEFSLAMHLINSSIKGFPTPDQLPETLIPHSKRGGYDNQISGTNLKRSGSGKKKLSLSSTSLFKSK
ncbi:hypothetical protein DFA_02428 [Cavenderia fasciculata]|uniref:Uncharacterized protein n=1 Tax=Cavenderia fasciculata TaxID=261658 RepID=F4PZF1_CACFS|nr:uncharacterized protein DFA_02428 [Cavenderia fasciculata]EGG19180.1 hypothetical protein DFA_02428 [Cavenderia fasciculata]|eukprot:XP_004366813.1 hypothetical protein DFA_02428 [Cavenderia fasciculata]